MGRQSTFGHPSSSTLATFGKAVTKIYRTDGCGALRLEIEDARVSTMLPYR